MRHLSPPDDRSGQPSLPRSPPRWTYAVSLASPSSGTEDIYDSPEEYVDEDVPAPSLAPSPKTKKRWDAEFEKDLAEITLESDE